MFLFVCLFVRIVGDIVFHSGGGGSSAQLLQPEFNPVENETPIGGEFTVVCLLNFGCFLFCLLFR